MRYHHLALIVLALAACRPDTSRQVASTGAALPFLPFPPQAEVVSRAGSADAVQITFRSKSTPTQVLNYYRVILAQSGWSLEGDAVDAVGAAALYALKDGHPMWIRISQTPGMPGTIVEISGAVVVSDSAAAANIAPAAPADSQAGR
jgi:hypothetical protein